MAFHHPLMITALALPLSLSATSDCGSSSPDDRDAVTDGGTWTVSYVPDPDPIPVQERFSLDVTVASAADPTDLSERATLAVDAWMPAHGHGMDTVPRVTPRGDGTFLVENMELSMTGEWEILMDVSESGRTEEASFIVDCCQ